MQLALDVCCSVCVPYHTRYRINGAQFDALRTSRRIGSWPLPMIWVVLVLSLCCHIEESLCIQCPFRELCCYSPSIGTRLRRLEDGLFSSFLATFIVVLLSQHIYASSRCLCLILFIMFLFGFDLLSLTSLAPLQKCVTTGRLTIIGLFIQSVPHAPTIH